MKQSIIRKLGISLAITAVMIPAVAAFSYAQSTINPLKPMQADTNPLACVIDGKLRYKDFLSSAVAYDGLVEYWVDIFGRNRCESYDIDSILSKLKQVRKGIRDAFYSCDEKRADNLGKSYNKLLVELYYVRNIVLNTDPKNPKTDTAVLNASLYQDMKSIFVDEKSYYTKTDFDALWDEFEKKYAIKKTMQEGSYLNCNDPVMDDLKDKVKEFWNTAGGIKTGAEEAAHKIERQAESLKNNPSANFGNSLGGWMDFKINNTEPKKALEQIYEASKKDIPFSDTIGISHTQLIDAEGKEAEEYKSRILDAMKNANFAVQYQQNTDSIREALENKLKSSNQTIKDSYVPLNSMTSCLYTVYTRQCK